MKNYKTYNAGNGTKFMYDPSQIKLTENVKRQMDQLAAHQSPISFKMTYQVDKKNGKLFFF